MGGGSREGELQDIRGCSHITSAAGGGGGGMANVITRKVCSVCMYVYIYVLGHRQMASLVTRCIYA